MTLRLLLALLVSTLLLAPPALAQDEGAEPEAEAEIDKPNPAAVMKAMHEKVAAINTISFKAHNLGVGGKAVRVPEVTANVIASRATNDPLGWKFLTEGNARDAGKDPRKLLAAYDGKVIRSVRDHEQKVVEGSVSSPDDAMNDGAGWVMTWLIRWPDLVHKCFGGEQPMVPSRYEGAMHIGGELCDVIYVDYSELADPTLFDAWWYIAQKDSLPRRVEMHFIAGSDGFTVLTLDNLKPGANASDSIFSLGTPEGYEVTKPVEQKREVGGRAVVQAGVPVGQVAPDWTLKDLEGKEHTLSKYRGKIVIMDFWATWCPPCREAMPGLQRVHEKYKDRGVVVFGLNAWESGDPGAFMKDNKYTYTTLVNADPVAQLYQVSGIPTFYIVGPDGKVLLHEVGFNPNFEEDVSELIDQLTRP